MGYTLVAATLLMFFIIFGLVRLILAKFELENECNSEKTKNIYLKNKIERLERDLELLAKNQQKAKNGKSFMESFKSKEPK